MTGQIKELDVVAILEDIPSNGLTQGETGTIVFDFGDGVYLVEFSDNLGQTYALLELRSNQLLPLHHVERAKIPA